MRCYFFSFRIRACYLFVSYVVPFCSSRFSSRCVACCLSVLLFVPGVLVRLSRVVFFFRLVLNRFLCGFLCLFLSRFVFVCPLVRVFSSRRVVSSCASRFLL